MTGIDGGFRRGQQTVVLLPWFNYLALGTYPCPLTQPSSSLHTMLTSPVHHSLQVACSALPIACLAACCLPLKWMSMQFLQPLCCHIWQAVLDQPFDFPSCMSCHLLVMSTRIDLWPQGGTPAPGLAATLLHVAIIIHNNIPTWSQKCLVMC